MIIVLDIGKTNKKVLLFSKDLEIIEIRKKLFPEIESEYGFRVEQTEAVEKWFFAQLKELSGKYNIKAISITTHSTNVVCLDENDNLSIPTIAYTNEAGTEIDNLFFERFGSFEKLQEETATAAIGSMINTARIMHFAREKLPEDFARTKKILFYPQYFGYKLTGKAAIEPTSLGSHTFLYNFYKHTYSRIANELGLTDFLPRKMNNPWDVIGTISKEVAQETGIPENCLVTTGIHDSNSSLLPYLINNNEKDFVLNSTGTWCVIMRPDKQVNFTGEDLGRTVYYNIDAYNNPVKTIIFMGGVEFESYNKIFDNLYPGHTMPDFDFDTYSKILENSDFIFLPSVIKGVGIYPKSTPKVLKDGETYTYEEIVNDSKLQKKLFHNLKESYAALNASLLAQTIVALKFTGFTETEDLFIEGGFVNNSAYTQLLADALKNTEVYTTNLQEATAIGAAILAIAALQNTDPRNLPENICKIEKKHLSCSGLKNTDKYTAAFIAAANKN